MIEYYAVTDDLRALANQLINNHFSHLAAKRVEFIFVVDRDSNGREMPPKAKGKDVWGRARVISGLGAYFAVAEEDRYKIPDRFFVIEIAKSVWERLENPKHKEALLHHELSHCELTETGQPTIVPHTLEEFTPTVREYGAWRHDVAAFVQASIEQMPLFQLAEMRTPDNDRALLETIEVEIEGKPVEVMRGQVINWIQQFERKQEQQLRAAKSVERNERIERKLESVVVEFKRKHPDVDLQMTG